ncbi:MAG TPA: hypothetical protein VIX73_23185 [Kofleriaceae bacterium]|jgi:ABC-type antimicrobial peptide transport system permease subunit
MVAYDEQVLQKFAAQLYRQALQVVITSTLVGVLLGAGVGWLLVNLRPMLVSHSVAIAGLAILFGLAGYSSGQAKAFMLRVQAQTLLCNAQIERNTKR